ncbi:MAG: ABC transporter permease [Verrucomicrobiales bacterium]
MTLPLIIWRSLRQHALSTVITALSIGLGAGLLMSVWAVKGQAQNTFAGVNSGFDAVLGARGSKLQLVLNSIFHLESSTGNIQLEDYEMIQKNPGVALAVPIATGDNYRGWRIVGTITEMFEKVELDSTGRRFRLATGRWFEPDLREAVLGSFAADQLELKIGDEFEPFHGITFEGAHQHEETYVVVGIMEPSNTPADRVIWIPLEGVQWMGGHDPRAATEVSAVLVKLKSGGLAAFQLDQRYNKQTDRLTFAWPIGAIVSDMFSKISWVDRVLEIIAWMVVVVATASMLASVYNSMHNRRRDLAILRALGARRWKLSAAVVLEAATIAAIGALIGFAVYAVIMGVISSVVRAQTGVALDPLAWHHIFLVGPLAIIALGILAGMIPAYKAYQTDVAENLVPH